MGKFSWENNGRFNDNETYAVPDTHKVSQKG